MAKKIKITQCSKNVNPNETQNKNDVIFKMYKIGFPKCPMEHNYQNCSNPHCLPAVVELYTNLEPELKRRQANTFVGLKNLGATCYINSLIQLWFHNTNFRNAILNWDPLDDEDEKQNSSLFIENSYEPITDIGHLQLIFTLMQFGNQQTVNPQHFIESLKIDYTVEEDAEEFSNFLLTSFHDKLDSQSNESVREVVKDNFFGEYNSVITCLKCKTESVTSSQFRELCLNIKCHKTLNDSLLEYFEKEKMTGNEKYYCSQCEIKQNAVRQIFLTSLPHLLNFKLMRYVYDNNLKMTKKINTEIRCPYTIDMVKFLDSSHESSKENHVYNLYGVLIHKGTYTNVGHYISHIKDLKTEEWYQMDDEKVTKLNINIQTNEYKTSSAYMLVYMRASIAMQLKKESPNITLTPRLTQFLNACNYDYENKLSKEIQNKESALLFSDIMLELKYTKVIKDEGDAISLEWLISLMEAKPDKKIYKINNNSIVCSHNKLNPNALHKTKYIGTKVADKLYGLYKGGPRLRLNSSLCEVCVKNKCALLKMSELTNEHSQLISKIQASQNNYSNDKTNSQTYWIGIESFECWQQKYLHMFQHFLKFNDIFPNVTLPINDEILVSKCKSLIGLLDDTIVKKGIKEKNIKNDEMGNILFEPEHNTFEYDFEVDMEEYLELLEQRRLDKSFKSDRDINILDINSDTGHMSWTFNEDITCPHGYLSIAKDTMKLVPEEVKNIFQTYYPKVQFFVKNTKSCSLCKTHYKMYIQKIIHSMGAVLQENVLNTLLFDDTRPDYPQENRPYFCITKNFFESWQKFVCNPSTEPKPHLIDNKSLLCKDHNELLFEPTSNFVTTDQSVSVIITKSEWLRLIDYYEADYGVFVYFDSKGKFQKSIPKVCQTCIKTPDEERNQFKDYINAKIFIQVTENSFKCKEADNEDEVLGNSIKKFKQNVASTNGTSEYEAATSSINICNSTSETRSVRKQMPLNQSITMSSNDTVFLLKEKIEEVYNVPPINQILKTALGKPLIESEAKLRDLKIYPESVIIAEFIDKNVTVNVAVKETGFKGLHL